MCESDACLALSSLSFDLSVFSIGLKAGNVDPSLGDQDWSSVDIAIALRGVPRRAAVAAAPSDPLMGVYSGAHAAALAPVAEEAISPTPTTAQQQQVAASQQHSSEAHRGQAAGAQAQGAAAGAQQ